MNGWNGHSSGSGAGHGPSEESGRSAWSSGETGAAPPWAAAETQTSFAPPWATARTQASPVPPWTPVTPAAPGPAHAPHRVLRVLAALAVAVLVGVSVGVGVWWLLRDTSLGSGTRTGAGPVPGVTAPSSPSPSASPASRYRRVQDPVGYSVDVPRGWTRTEKQGRFAPVVVYDAPADGRRLQVFRIAEDTPAQSLDLAEKDPGYGFARQPGYQVLDRAMGTTWAELAYRYDDSGLGARQVVDHRFQAADGTLYAIRATGPASLTPALVREPLTRALASFCPADTECR
ncbi:hypothetical protein [Streptomyces sp. CC0208]|nr:hypothetical protein [Streptomyces sp. CC0208]